MIDISNMFWIALAVFVKSSNSLSIQNLTLAPANIPEDGRLQFCELANKYGYECIRYNVTTEDGYILGLYNIPGDKKKPIFVQHGFLDSSDTFLIRANASLVAFLASKGYDIWLGNMRGNKHSRAHQTLDPEGTKFWEFSFHEISIYDMPAMIDFILNKTNQNQLQVIGHSLGNTVFFVLGAMRPKYNDKVKVLICLGPVVYIQNAEGLFPLRSPITGPAIMKLLPLLHPGELFGNSSNIMALYRAICTQGRTSSTICLELFSIFVGRDTEQLEPEFVPIAVGHLPSGTSINNAIHLLQLAFSKQFAEYDYGLIKNKEKYNSVKPPVYDISKVTMKVALVVGLSDKFTNPKDIALLRSQLPNVVDYHIMKRKKWNHIDFLIGNNMTELFDYLNNILDK